MKRYTIRKNAVVILENDTEIARVSIASENSKLKGVYNIALTPGSEMAGGTCSAEACENCHANGCFGRNCYERFPGTRRAWDRNTDAFRNHLEDVAIALDMWFTKYKPEFFRINVAGDLFSVDVIAMWDCIAEAHPDTLFLAYSKQYANVTEYIKRYGKTAHNFKLYASTYPGMYIPEFLQHTLPIASMFDDTGLDIPKKSAVCPGSCADCKHCFLPEAGNIVFPRHGRGISTKRHTELVNIALYTFTGELIRK